MDDASLRVAYTGGDFGTVATVGGPGCQIWHQSRANRIWQSGKWSYISFKGHMIFGEPLYGPDQTNILQADR